MANKITIFKSNESYVSQMNELIDQLNLKNTELSHYTKALNKVAIVSKTNLKGYITFANDFFCNVCGYTKEELLGQNHNIIRHPDVPKAVFKELWDTIQSGKTWEGNVKNRAKDGEPYYVHATIIPLFESDGKTIKEYIAIRFLTTSDEMEKREFKKKVMMSYQEFKKENYNYQQKIKSLEKELAQIRGEDNYLKTHSHEDKEKHNHLLKQIKHYEDEIKQINSHHEKVLEINNQNAQKMGESYKKTLKIIDQNTATIHKLEEEKSIKTKEVVKLEDKIIEQRKIITDLHDTIKHIQQDEENKKKKKGLFDKLL